MVTMTCKSERHTYKTYACLMSEKSDFFSGRKKLFGMATVLWKALKVRLIECISKKAAVDTDLFYGIFTINPELIGTFFLTYILYVSDS